MMTCSKMYGMLRDPGVPLSLEQVATTKINWSSLIVGASMCFSILPWSQINVLLPCIPWWWLIDFLCNVAMSPWSLATFGILSATWRRMAASWTTRASTRRTSSPTTARGQSSRPLWVSSLVLLIFFANVKGSNILWQDPGDIETCLQFDNLISCKVSWILYNNNILIKLFLLLADGILQKYI